MPLSNYGDDFDTDEPSFIQKQMSYIGHLGGRSTAEKLGSEHMKKIGGEGGRKTFLTRGPQYYKELGRKGGLAKAKKKGEGSEPST